MLKKNSIKDSALEKFNLTKYYYNSNCPYLFIFPLLILNLLYSWWGFFVHKSPTNLISPFPEASQKLQND